MPDRHVVCKTREVPQRCHLCGKEGLTRENTRHFSVPYGLGLPKEGRTKRICETCLHNAISVYVELAQHVKAQEMANNPMATAIKDGLIKP